VLRILTVATFLPSKAVGAVRQLSEHRDVAEHAKDQSVDEGFEVSVCAGAVDGATARRVLQTAAQLQLELSGAMAQEQAAADLNDGSCSDDEVAHRHTDTPTLARRQCSRVFACLLFSSLAHAKLASKNKLVLRASMFSLLCTCFQA
jgi:hypothetical protein